MATTEQALASREAALGAQDADNISTHYAEDAVVIVNGSTYLGPREISSMYAKFFKAPPDATWSADVTVIHDDLAYVE